MKKMVAVVRFEILIPVELDEDETEALERGTVSVSEAFEGYDLLATAKARVPTLTIDDVDLDWEYDEAKG